MNKTIYIFIIVLLSFIIQEIYIIKLFLIIEILCSLLYMQRKTNLFYTTTQDSNFLTFSNYTEALTGNFLATDWKVYPSKFLCLYIPSLTKENREEFIKTYITSYYENKLAFLRDYYNESRVTDLETYDIEEDIHSLAWLFSTIKKFDENAKVTFIGEVTEFDYKGTYTDTICIINSTDGLGKDHVYSIAVDDSQNLEYNNDTNILYGWTSEELVGTPYESINNILLDTDNGYFTQSDYTLTVDEEQPLNITFNVIIPLFDIIDINYQTNFDNIEEQESLVNEEGKLVDSKYNESEIKSINNPLGIWFAENIIVLERDENTKYAPSWAIVISSQFKPFPYSNNYHNDNITQKDNQLAFQTYAQILAMQENLSHKINDIYLQLAKLTETVNKLNNLENNQTLQDILSMKDTSKQLQDVIDNIGTMVSDEVSTQLEKIKLVWNKVNIE